MYVQNIKRKKKTLNKQQTTTTKKYDSVLGRVHTECSGDKHVWRLPNPPLTLDSFATAYHMHKIYKTINEY